MDDATGLLPRDTSGRGIVAVVCRDTDPVVPKAGKILQKQPCK